ncbi:hypothetical protein MNBD_GAMMA08-861 [hydrothermal vent metagenome]|uniref:N-acetyltransferase domain-containing protein n=1 Tax=hydrothermal vent metagenome TaxID=652676 RepID=A0A3B0XHZ6_9ZZZZ
MIITSPKTESQLQQYFHLRWRMLRKPWGEPEGSEQDDTDKKNTDHCYHVMAVENNIVIGVARLEFPSTHVTQLRYMAVDKKHQGKGVGHLMIEHVEDYARNKNTTELFLNARENAVGFYEKLGYKITEKSYLLFDSIQHYKMSKFL